jgi:hypothetical protein
MTQVSDVAPGPLVFVWPDATRPADRLFDAPQLDLPTTSTDYTASYLGYSKDK